MTSQKGTKKKPLTLKDFAGQQTIEFRDAALSQRLFELYSNRDGYPVIRHLELKTPFILALIREGLDAVERGAGQPALPAGSSVSPSPSAEQIAAEEEFRESVERFRNRLAGFEARRSDWTDVLEPLKRELLDIRRKERIFRRMIAKSDDGDEPTLVEFDAIIDELREKHARARRGEGVVDAVRVYHHLILEATGQAP